MRYEITAYWKRKDANGDFITEKHEVEINDKSAEKLSEVVDVFEKCEPYIAERTVELRIELKPE